MHVVLKRVYTQALLLIIYQVGILAAASNTQSFSCASAIGDACICSFAISALYYSPSYTNTHKRGLYKAVRCALCALPSFI